MLSTWSSMPAFGEVLIIPGVPWLETSAALCGALGAAIFIMDPGGVGSTYAGDVA